MARYLEIDTRSARRYVAGDRPIPETLAAWLERLAASPDWRETLREYPYPDDWKAVQASGEWEWVEEDDDDETAELAKA